MTKSESCVPSQIWFWKLHWPVTEDSTMITNAGFDYSEFDTGFSVGVNVINECCTRFLDFSCLFHQLIKTKEESNIIPCRGLLEVVNFEIIWTLNAFRCFIRHVYTFSGPFLIWCRFLYTYLASNGFVLDSVTSTQMNSVSISRSDLRINLFSVKLWTYRARPVCKGNHCHDAKQSNQSWKLVCRLYGRPNGIHR